MTFTVTSALVATLVASFMFALWYQGLKHLKDYPLAGFVFWLYISSYVTVWCAVGLFGASDIPMGIAAELSGKGLAALGVAAGGACMTWGLIISLAHMKTNGMVANQAVMGSIGSIFGLIINFVVGGLAPGISLPLVVIAAAILILASGIIQQSTVIKYAEKGVDITSRKVDKEEGQPDSLFKQNITLILSNLLMIGYSIAYMLGTRSELHPEGFPALLCVLLLVHGSLFAAVTYAVVSLTRSHKWHMLMAPQMKLPILLGLGAGFCHYGGTVLQMYSLPLLSAPVSALIQKTSSLWTFMWGIAYGEYKGCSRKAKLYLASGIAVFMLGICLLTYALYF